MLLFFNHGDIKIWNRNCVKNHLFSILLPSSISTLQIFEMYFGKCYIMKTKIHLISLIFQSTLKINMKCVSRNSCFSESGQLINFSSNVIDIAFWRTLSKVPHYSWKHYIFFCNLSTYNKLQRGFEGGKRALPYALIQTRDT